MKIIDLLKKIANGEEVPKKIKYERDIWKYDSGNNTYDNGNYCLFEDYIHDNYSIVDVLNDEVEIIEEDKKIEKMVYCEENTFKNMKECTYLSPEEKRLLDSNFKELGDKINEIIDYINKGDK